MGRKKPPPKYFDPTLEMYERQPNEPEKEWAAFCIYRDLGELRTVRKAAIKYIEVTGGMASEKDPADPAKTTLEHMSHDWRWRERVEAWDREQDRVFRMEFLKQKKKMYARHIKNFLLLESIGMNQAVKIARKADASDEPIFSEKLALEYIETGAKGSLRSMGEPDTVTENRNEIIFGDEVRTKRERLRAILADSDAMDALEKIIDQLEPPKEK